MQHDWFLDLAYREIERIARAIHESRSSSSSLALLGDEWFKPKLPEPAKNVRVAAVDGGGGTEELVGGDVVYVVRAAAVYSFTSSIDRDLRMHLSNFKAPSILEALRNAVELDVALKALERLERGSFLLIDGSYLAVTCRHLSKIVKVYRKRESSQMSDIYALPYHVHVLAKLSSLIKEASRRGVTIAFVSKDTSFRILKEHLILRKLQELADEDELRKLKAAIEASLKTYPLRGRHLFVEAARNAKGEAKELLELLLNTAFRDTHLVSRALEEHNGVGYTKPLVVGLAFRELSRIAGKLREVLADSSLVYRKVTGREPGYEPQEVAKALERLPAAGVCYVKLGSRDQPLLLESLIQGKALREARIELGSYDSVDNIVPVLVRGYKNPVYYNVWLVAAHERATLKRSALKLYMSLLEKVYCERYHKPLPLARRVVMGAAL